MQIAGLVLAEVSLHDWQWVSLTVPVSVTVVND